MRTLGDLNVLIGADPALSALRTRVARVLSDDPGHDLAHCLRVALWTVRLAGPRVPPRDAVAAALCHDIVNVPKNSAKRATASTRSADAARRLLASHGFERARVELITAAIRDHSYSRGAVPESDLGRALQDADRLDALGAIGIMRTISTGVRMRARYFDPDDPWAASRPLDDRAFSIDHFFTKLLHLPRTMQTPGGRAEAQRRVRILRRFLDALSREIAVPLTR